MDAADIIRIGGGALLAAVGGIAWLMRLSWQASALSSRVDALSSRLSEHNDGRERLARLEALLESLKALVERIEQRLDRAA